MPPVAVTPATVFECVCVCVCFSMMACERNSCACVVVEQPHTPERTYMVPSLSPVGHLSIRVPSDRLQLRTLCRPQPASRSVSYVPLCPRDNFPFSCQFSISYSSVNFPFLSILNFPFVFILNFPFLFILPISGSFSFYALWSSSLVPSVLHVCIADPIFCGVTEGLTCDPMRIW